MVQLIAVLKVGQGSLAVNDYEIAASNSLPVAVTLNSYAVQPEPIESVIARATAVLQDNGWQLMGHWHSDWRDPDCMEAAVRKRPVLLRWVKRNWDQPHRCPLCHHIAHKVMYRAVGGQGYGLRTAMACPGRCLVKWRVGSRLPRQRMRDKYKGCRKP